MNYCPILSIRRTGVLDYTECIDGDCQFYDPDDSQVCVVYQLRKVKPLLNDLKGLLQEISGKL